MDTQRQNRLICTLFLLCILLFFLTNQYICITFPKWVLGYQTTKCLASASAVFLCAFGCRSNLCRPLFLLTFGLAICALADVVINIHAIAGIILFAFGHMIFCLSFLSENNPRRWQYIIYISTVFISCCVIWHLHYLADALAIPVLGYALVLAAMVTLSLSKFPLLRIGSLLFALSDILLARSVLFVRTPLSQFISLGVYYIALSMIALTPWFSQQLETN